MDKPPHRRSLWGPRRHGSAVAQPVHDEWGRGPAPPRCALAVAHELLDTPVADRPNWTLPRLAEEIEQRAGVRISPSRLSVVLRKKGALAGGGRGTR